MNHFCYLLIEDGETTGMITGDTVFNAGIGNCHNGGDVEIYYQTMKNIINPLDDDITIYPSHDYFLNNLTFAKSIEPENKYIDQYIGRVEDLAAKKEFYITTLGEERLFNPFFRVFTLDFKSKFNKNEKELFIELRAKRDRW